GWPVRWASLPGGATEAPQRLPAKPWRWCTECGIARWLQKCTRPPAGRTPLQEAIVVGSRSHRSAKASAQTLPLSSERAGTTASALFPGFERMSFRVGTHWEYSWRETCLTNCEADPVQSGVVRIELSDPVEVDFGPAGVVTLYEATCAARSGLVPIWWPQWRYLGVKEGALYGAAELEDGDYGGVLLFDPKTGATHPRGFMGWSPSGARSVAL